MKPLSSAFVFAALLLPNLASADSTTSAFIQGNYAKQRVTAISTVPPGKFTIDGDLGDWADVPVGNGVIDEVVDHSMGSLNGDVRGAATFRFAHDNAAFYVAVAVADPSLVPSPDPAALYNGDAVELFLDFRPASPSPSSRGGNAGSMGVPKYAAGCYQLLVAAPIDGQPMRQMDGNLGGKPLGPYDVAEKAIAGGYSVEVKIPYTSLVTGASPLEEGAGEVTAARMSEPIGFDVSIDDFDMVAGTIGARRSWCWSGNADQWEDASTFGIADPGFTGHAPSPLLRTAPAVYVNGSAIGIKTKDRILVAGSMAPLSTPAPSMDFKVATLPAAKLGDAHMELTDYPGLGVTIHRTWSSASTLATGTYKAVTSFSAGLRQTVKFEAVASAGASGGKAGKPFPTGQVAANKTVESTYVLPNGLRITPAGKHIALPGDMPESFVWLDKTHLAVNTGGYHDQGVDVIDVTTNKVIQTFPVKQTWGSMAFANGELIVPGGHAAKSGGGKFSNGMLMYMWHNGKFVGNLHPDIDTTMGTDQRPVDTDLFVSSIGGDNAEMPFAVNINGDKLYRLGLGYDKAYHVVDYAATGYHPSAVAEAPDDKSVVVANWGDASVTAFDTSTIDVSKLPKIRTVKVGSHPVALAYSQKKGDGRLFVVCSGSNAVDVIDGGQVTETIKTSLDPADLVGSTPVAVAISPDDMRLYVANADNNDICVVDISAPGQSRVIGFIPTGWYPSALTVSPDGRKLYVATGKGLGFSANAKGKYIASILSGDVSVVTLPDAGHLADYTYQVADNLATSLPVTSGWIDFGRPGGAYTAQDASRYVHHASLRTPSKTKLAGKIKHVLYIIRENRTYDQVLGDDSRGNGDPSITMFGKDVTPNAHKLVKDYVLLDNVYCNGEVSESGHQWCDAAYCTDFVERAWVNSYSGRGEPDADDRLTASPAGYLWDNCARHGVSYYSYGEFSSFTATPNRAPVYTGEGSLRGHCNEKYGAAEWDKRDTVCAGYFVDDLHKAEKTGVWPSFMIMGLPEDHTHGLGTGAYTPPACVASNDLALGQIVEAISHSRFWKDTAIFVIEDDAQDGPDHVDAHRTVALAISPYIKRGTVDHTMYTTASIVRTTEDILGLPPMTQYDENATPLWNSFDNAPVLTAYAHVAPHIDIMAKNLAGPVAIESAKLDFSAPDRVDPDTLNALLWHALKPGVPMPAPVRSGILMAQGAR